MCCRLRLKTMMNLFQLLVRQTPSRRPMVLVQWAVMDQCHLKVIVNLHPLPVAALLITDS